MQNMKKLLMLSVTFWLTIILFAQPSQQLIRIDVKPNSADWNYKTGEKVKFDITVTKNSIPVSGVQIRYELSNDMMPAFEKKELTLQKGTTTIDAGTMKVPGFLRCIVNVNYNGRNYQGMATAGFDTEKIQPTTTLPSDFWEFWNNAKAENAKLPLNVKKTLLTERCTDKVDVYHVSFQNYRAGSRIYAILCIPKGEGKYPAVLKVPGAGVRAYGGDIGKAENGIITLEIGIHGIPVILDEQVYDNLRKTALSDYSHANWDDRDKVYYKKVYLGCVKAIDYIFSLDKFDGESLIVEGGRQGGALAIVTTALDSRVKGLISYYPALCDFTGYLNNRAGGWPHLFRNTKDSPCVLEQKVKTTQYYDVVNFARHIKVPGYYSFGYNDMVCPPTSMFSAINVINAPKEIYIVPETAHWTYPDQWKRGFDWSLGVLKGNK